jgi:hypothetical protein
MTTKKSIVIVLQKKFKEDFISRFLMISTKAIESLVKIAKKYPQKQCG